MMAITHAELTALPVTPYSEARAHIRNGDILLFAGNEPFSELIRHFTKSDWSHVGFIWRMDDIDRVMLLESVEHAGVRAVSLSSRVNGGGAFAHPYNGDLLIARHTKFPELGDEARKAFGEMTRRAVDRLGCPYAADEIAKIALRIAAGMANLRLPGHLEPKGAYICSEYAAECYQAMGIEIPMGEHGFIAPSDFAAAEHIEPVVRIGRG